jgi:hypothetical protein
MQNIRNLYKTGSLKMAERELGKYKLVLVGVQEVRWENSGTELAQDYTFFYGEENEGHQLGKDFFTHKRIISVVRRVQSVSDRMLYTKSKSMVQYYCSECAQPK